MLEKVNFTRCNSPFINIKTIIASYFWSCNLAYINVIENAFTLCEPTWHYKLTNYIWAFKCTDLVRHHHMRINKCKITLFKLRSINHAPSWNHPNDLQYFPSFLSKAACTFAVFVIYYFLIPIVVEVVKTCEVTTF